MTHLHNCSLAKASAWFHIRTYIQLTLLIRLILYMVHKRQVAKKADISALNWSAAILKDRIFNQPSVSKKVAPCEACQTLCQANISVLEHAQANQARNKLGKINAVLLQKICVKESQHKGLVHTNTQSTRGQQLVDNRRVLTGTGSGGG